MPRKAQDRDHVLDSRPRCQFLEIGTSPLAAVNCHTAHLSDVIQSNIPVSLRRSQVVPFAPTAFRSHVSFECWLAFISRIRELKPNDTRCPHRPAVEITRYITLDAKTGEIEIPDGSRFVRPFPCERSQDNYPWNSSLPKGKPWGDVELHNKD